MCAAVHSMDIKWSHSIKPSSYYWLSTWHEGINCISLLEIKVPKTSVCKGHLLLEKRKGGWVDSKETSLAKIVSKFQVLSSFKFICYDLTITS